MITVVCALIIQNKKILITQLGENTDRPYLWEFPGGKVEKNETAEKALIREIREELNLEITVEKEMLSVVHAYPLKKIELVPFICSIKNGKLKLTEHLNFKWISFHGLASVDFSAADKNIIKLKNNQVLLKEYLGK